MVTQPVIEKSTALEKGIWQERLKSKDFYREMRFHRRMAGKRHRLLKRITMIAVAILAVSIIPFLWGSILIFGSTDNSIQLDPFFTLLMLVGLAGVPIPGIIAWLSYNKTKALESNLPLYSLLGILSQQLAEECPNVDLFVDFRDTTKTTPYKMRKSPYSGAKKMYYNHHWLRIVAISLDGIKFAISSRRKVKTKGGSRRMDTTSFTIRFSFHVENSEKLSKNRLDELEKIIKKQITPHHQETLVVKVIKVDYPAAGVIRFTQKITVNSISMIPVRVMETFGEFSAAIQNKYPEHSGFKLHPLKQFSQEPEPSV